MPSYNEYLDKRITVKLPSLKLEYGEECISEWIPEEHGVLIEVHVRDGDLLRVTNGNIIAFQAETREAWFGTQLTNPGKMVRIHFRAMGSEPFVELVYIPAV